MIRRTKEEIEEYYRKQSEDRETRIERQGDIALLVYGIYLLFLGSFLTIAGYVEYADKPILAMIMGIFALAIGIWGTNKTIKKGTIFNHE